MSNKERGDNTLEFNEKLQELRKSKNMTQEQLAEQLFFQGLQSPNGNPVEDIRALIL